MATLKTQPTGEDVARFLAAIPDAQRNQDAHAICDIMQKVSGQPPKMWGGAIVGFGSYHYTYASGREGDWMLMGFSPRKASLTIYVMDGLERHKQSLSQLGPHTTSKSCLYIKNMDNINKEVLQKILMDSIRHIQSGQATL